MIQLISATKGSLNTTLLHNSVSHVHSVAFSENNTDPLPIVYNDAIDDFKLSNDWLVFVHDDVIIEAPEALERQLNTLGNNFDVIGCAGARDFTLKEPALWHLMSDKTQYRGAVAHLHDDGRKFMTSFGVYPDRVILIDGVFIAAKTKVFDKVRFDTNNPAGFHFYDLDFSLACHKAGFKIGVGDITITHASPGLKHITDDWKQGQGWFLKKWKSK